MNAEARKFDMSFKDLPYFKIFTPAERAAAKAGTPYMCQICRKILFSSDIFNLRDVLNLVIVCPKCKTKYQKAFDKKRDKLRKENDMK